MQGAAKGGLLQAWSFYSGRTIELDPEVCFLGVMPLDKAQELIHWGEEVLWQKRHCWYGRCWVLGEKRWALVQLKGPEDE